MHFLNWHIPTFWDFIHACLKILKEQISQVAAFMALQIRI